MAGEAVVSVISREMVVPAKRTERQSYFLSCFDISWKGSRRSYQRVIFYEGVLSGQERDGRRAVMEKLKSSLALCLVHYYPCCGRFSEAGDRLSIDCNDAGVEFVEASLPLPISHLSRRGFQVQPLFQQLSQKLDHCGHHLYTSPLVSIQATLFSDGGLALSCTRSHVLADGQALWNLMVSWGESARGLPLSFPPFLDRKMLAVPHPSLEEATGELNPKTKQEEDKGDIVGTGPFVEENNVETHAFLDEALERIPCIVNLPSSAVKKLKIEDGGIHTSYEVTCAHLWQRLTAARQRPFHEPTYFFAIANFRSRVTPPLPPTFFGNATVFGISVSTSGKICSESLHATASRIHDTIAKITQDAYVKSFMHWLETHDNDVISVIIQNMPKGKGVNVAGSSRFPVYEVDFGWGKPTAVRSSHVLEDGEMLFFGGHTNSTIGDVEICMALPSFVLRRLLEDSSFLGKPLYSPYEDE